MALASPPPSRALAFARELQRASTFDELLLATKIELAAALDYKHAWLYVAEDESLETLRLLGFAADDPDRIDRHVTVLTVAGDAMLEELVAGDAPVVVEDARTDPRTNKELVAQLGCRTLINIPLRLIDRPLGAFGTGTFGDEGVRAPTPDQLEYLVVMASQLAVAAGRIRFLEERERAANALEHTRSQLRQAQKMEAIGRLAGGVAHDFNNLLSVILSYASLLLDDLPADDTRRFDVEEIRRAGQRAAELTAQMLAFSRNQPVVSHSLDLDAVLVAVEPMIRRLVGETIEVHTARHPGLDRIRGDPGQLEQVIVNLVVNARDAMPSGGRIAIETANVDLDEGYALAHAGVLPGPHVMLAVSDSGSGIDKATQERIFEPFFTTKEHGKGSGLGLAIVYGIVKQHAGDIWLYSELGRGTTFKLYFPRDESIEVPAAPRAVVPSARRGHESILLVEDDDQLREVAREILERHGYRVLVARHGLDALELAGAGEGAIDLMVTDVVMPQLGGLELAERIAAVRPGLRVLYMSGYTEHAMQLRSGHGGELMLLHKPITPEALLQRVRQVLDAE